jgi:hypothetical protein
MCASWRQHTVGLTKKPSRRRGLKRRVKPMSPWPGGRRWSSRRPRRSPPPRAPYGLQRRLRIRRRRGPERPTAPRSPVVSSRTCRSATGGLMAGNHPIARPTRHRPPAYPTAPLQGLPARACRPPRDSVLWLTPPVPCPKGCRLQLRRPTASNCEARQPVGAAPSKEARPASRSWAARRTSAVTASWIRVAGRAPSNDLDEDGTLRPGSTLTPKS